MKTPVIIPVFIPHSGCEYLCVYCNQKRITGKRTPPSPLEVKKYVEGCLDRLPNDIHTEIAFYGGSFTALSEVEQESYLQCIQPFIREGRVESVRVSTRPDVISLQGLHLLKGYGVKTIELGVQSLDYQVLIASGRRYEPSQVGEASLLIKENGFRLGHQLMIGLPGSTREKELLTTSRSVEMGPEMARIYPTLVLKGTRLARMYQEGQFQPLTLEDAVETSALLLTVLEKAGIKVIRMGLQPTPELLTAGEIIAGPFHPAFGELVEARVFREQAVLVIKEYWKDRAIRDLKLFVNRKDISKMIGQGRCNLDFLTHQLALHNCQVVGLKGPERNWIGVGNKKNNYPELVLSRQEFYEIAQVSVAGIRIKKKEESQWKS